MTQADTNGPMLYPTGTRRPRIAIMGEFSAGKTTLANLLLGEDSLPVKVTATQLPPVWISSGNDAPYRVDLDGGQHPVDLERIEDVPLNQTEHIRLYAESDILELCDFLDMPGISDPNMGAEVWQRALRHADGIIWCTHATQAWRQSEAAVWQSMPDAVRSNSLMLITRIDKLLADRDRDRVIKRVQSLAGDQFAGIFPISLTDALEAGEDEELWEASGAHEFASALIELIDRLADSPPADPGWDPMPETAEPPGEMPEEKVHWLDAAHEEDPDRVLPSRVRPKGHARTRPDPGQAPASLNAVVRSADP